MLGNHRKEEVSAGEECGIVKLSRLSLIFQLTVMIQLLSTKQLSA